MDTRQAIHHYLGTYDTKTCVRTFSDFAYMLFITLFVRKFNFTHNRILSIATDVTI